MKERPILFSGPMVKAILEGRKTQTRRVLKPQPLPWAEAVEVAPYNGYGKPGSLIQRTFDDRLQCGLCRPKFGKVGDRIWVRENMPRLPFPITLEITGIRVEPLQKITEEDAKAEGAEDGLYYRESRTFHQPTDEDEFDRATYRDGFAFVWDSINFKRGFGWETNPWVWVLEFKRII